MSDMPEQTSERTPTNKPDISTGLQSVLKRSKALHFLLAHAARISSLGFLGGNLVLFANGFINTGSIDFNMYSLAGLVFIISSIPMWWGGRDAKFIRMSGYGVTLAYIILCFAGFGIEGLKDILGFSEMVTDDNNFSAALLQFSGSLPGVVSGYLMTRTGKPPLSAAAPDSGFIKRVFGFIDTYPLIASAIIQFPNRPFYLAVALINLDIALALTVLCWLIGNIGLGAADPYFKTLLDKNNDKS